MSCAKQLVSATIISKDFGVWTATNSCGNPQAVCPRGSMPSGQGYELCASICRQRGHAEIQALRLAGDKAKGATMYISGHTYSCRDCKKALAEAGISKVVILGKKEGGMVIEGTFFAIFVVMTLAAVFLK